MDRQRPDHDQYLHRIEALAHELVAAAIEEDSFEVYLDREPKTPLQGAITRLARNLRHTHYRGDGCIPGEAEE
jgi:hypothetical protein